MENIRYLFLLQCTKVIQKPLEAMSSGCMVVAFENKNIEEIIENNQNGFIFHDFKDLPNLLNKIITIKNCLS